MKQFVLLSFALLIAINTFAQKNYAVVYRVHMPYNLKAVYEEIQKKGIKVDDKDAINSKEEKNYKNKLFKEMMKSIDNRMEFSGLCTPHAQYFSVYTRESTQNDFPDNAIVSQRQRNDFSIINDYTNYRATIFNRKNSVVDTFYKILDTATMFMIPTQQVREFNGRKGVEYIPKDERYQDMSLWIDSTLPVYIHPSAYWGLGVNGGVIAITFKSSERTITLEHIKETTEEIPHINHPAQPVAKLYLPFGDKLGEL